MSAVNVGLALRGFPRRAPSPHVAHRPCIGSAGCVVHLAQSSPSAGAAGGGSAGGGRMPCTALSGVREDVPGGRSGRDSCRNGTVGRITHGIGGIWAACDGIARGIDSTWTGCGGIAHIPRMVPRSGMLDATGEITAASQWRPTTNRSPRDGGVALARRPRQLGARARGEVEGGSLGGHDLPFVALVAVALAAARGQGGRPHMPDNPGAVPGRARAPRAHLRCHVAQNAAWCRHASAPAAVALWVVRAPISGSPRAPARRAARARCRPTSRARTT